MDLGGDCIYKYELRPKFKEGEPFKIDLPKGCGPRHIAFSPDSKHMYVITELSDEVITFDYDAESGNVVQKQIVKASDAGARGGAEVEVSPDGKYLYASVRLKDDGVAVFKINPDGTLQKTGYQKTGKHPRSFENTFLLPMPADSARITVRLYHANQQEMVRFTHTVRPEDILIRQLDCRQVAPHRYLLQSGRPEEKIDVAIVAEGYTEGEMEQFYAAAQETVDAILSHEPFGRLKDRFNFVAVGLPSAQSGVSVPHEGSWTQSALSSHFSTFYSDRYLTTLHLFDLHNALTGIPYEHIVILANTETYGGGGIYNSYTSTTSVLPW